MKKTILAICAAIAIFSVGIACHAEELALTYPEAYCSSGPEFKACVKKYAAVIARRNADPEAAAWARVYIGMPASEALRVFVVHGINTTVTLHGMHEQWVLGEGNYLYFKNDRLVSYQRHQ